MSRNLRNQNFDNQSGNNEATGEDLDWLAFQYVSDELPQLQREQFEKRLETDLDAQTALVDVMQQSQLIYATLDSEQRSESKTVLADRSAVATRRPLLGRQSALIAAAAAVLLMVAGWAIYNSQNAPNGPSGIASTNAPIPTDLAVAWADTIADRDLILIESELDELADEVELVDFVSDDSSEDAEDWMFIALVDLEESTEVLE